jgi:uncharacterized membrane-anchored protein YitT (DUF2179 family)
MNPKIKSIWRDTREYVSITIGLLLYAFAWKGFLLPHQITGGGVTGVAAIVYYAVDIPVYITYFVINFFLLIASVITIGWKFSIRSIYGVFVLTFFLSIMPQSEIGTFVSETDGFMACVIGGIIWGVGYAMLFLSSGSSGGTTIIAKIINKKSNISLGRALLYCDVIIICSSYFFVNENLIKVVYGLVTMSVTTYVVDLVVNGVRQSVQFIIFSKDYEKIANKINIEIGRGVTVFNAMGWHSQQEGKGIIIVARKHESSTIFHLIKDIDPNAFISQSEVIGVHGKGFDGIK